MTNDELAAEIERLTGERVRQGTIATRTRRAYAVADFVADNLPAILAALRTPASTVGEGAVEWVMAVVENAFIIGVRLAHGRSHVGEQWLINNNWGRYRERLMPQARAALSAAPPPVAMPETGAER